MKRFHRAFYAFMRFIIKPYFFFKGYRPERYNPKSKTYLVLTNHNTNWDFFLYGLVLKKHMYFVASEHIFRKGFTSWIIRTLSDPIPRKKGAASDDTVAMIKKRLSEGSNVCMMAEGNRSFSGRTGYISKNTAKLVKECGAGLVTLAIHGCYFVNPRWSGKTRNGPTWGRVVNEYTPEDLEKMSVDEIYECICSDLYVDAYEDQKGHMYKYRCRKGAEKLETALFWCPECKKFGTMKSSGDEFFCTDCGYSVRFNKCGFFEGENVLFDTIASWYDAELKYLKEYLAEKKDSDEPIYCDENEVLSRIHPEKDNEVICRGRLSLYPDRLEISGDETYTCYLSEIKKISITLTDTILLTSDKGYFEIRPSDGLHCALKYLASTYFLKGKEYY